MFKPRPQLIQHLTGPQRFTSQPGQQNQTGPNGAGAGSGGGGTGGSGDGAGGTGNNGGTGSGDGGTNGTSTTGKQGDPANGDLGPGGLKALDAERTRADNAEKAARDERNRAEKAEQALADSKLSAEQLAQKAIDDAKAESQAKAGELTVAQLTIARYEAAAAADLPLAMAKRLVGNTAAELEADAKAFAATLPRNGRTPLSDHSQGKGGGTTRTGGSVAAAKEEHLATRKK